MKNKRDVFERAIQEKLEQHEVYVPSTIWNALKNNLPEKEEPKIFSYFLNKNKLFAFIGLFILASIGTGILIHSTNDDTQYSSIIIKAENQIYPNTQANADKSMFSINDSNPFINQNNNNVISLHMNALIQQHSKHTIADKNLNETFDIASQPNNTISSQTNSNNTDIEVRKMYSMSIEPNKHFTEHNSWSTIQGTSNNIIQHTYKYDSKNTNDKTEVFMNNSYKKTSFNKQEISNIPSNKTTLTKTAIPTNSTTQYTQHTGLNNSSNENQKNTAISSSNTTKTLNKTFSNRNNNPEKTQANDKQNISSTTTTNNSAINNKALDSAARSNHNLIPNIDFSSIGTNASEKTISELTNKTSNAKLPEDNQSTTTLYNSSEILSNGAKNRILDSTVRANNISISDTAITSITTDTLSQTNSTNSSNTLKSNLSVETNQYNSANTTINTKLATNKNALNSISNSNLLLETPTAIYSTTNNQKSIQESNRNTLEKTANAYTSDSTINFIDSLQKPLVKSDTTKIKIEEDSINQKQKNRLSKISFDGFVSPAAAFIQTNATPSNDSVIYSNSQNKKIGFGVTIGARASYIVSPKFEVGLGIQYSSIKQTIDYSFQTLDSTYLTYQGHIKIDSIYDTTTQAYTQINTYVITDSTTNSVYSNRSESITNKYQNISIPIYLAYTYRINDKFRLAARSSILFNITTYSITYTTENNILVGYQSEKIFSIGAAFSIGGYYTLNNSITLFAEPIFTYYFKDLFGNQVPFKQSIMSIGLQTGVRIHF